jgi:CubicO group peptidase (beta-lactamase class C family)
VALQQLLMDVTGKPFAALMRALILEPLGMEDTTFEQPLPQPRWAVAARGHRNGGQPVQGGWFVYPEMAQVGLWTTASDVGRVVVEVQRARAGRPSRILSTRMATETLSPLVNGHVGLGIFKRAIPRVRASPITGETRVSRVASSGSVILDVAPS